MCQHFTDVRVCLCESVANKIKNLLFFKIFFTIVVVLGLIACKKVQQPALQSNTGRMLQVELKMPEAWKRIAIGPKNAKAYPKVPRTFSMFMTGESAVALKPYLIISSKISQLGQQRPLNRIKKYGKTYENNKNRVS